MPRTLAITGGSVYDPHNGWEGSPRDLFIQDGRLVDRLAGAPDQVFDARGLAVTPAGIELRGAVAGYGCNYLRLWGALPSPRELGEAYALLGYTHLHEPNLTLATANYVHHELAAIPIVDTSASLTLNLRDFDLWLRDPAHTTGLSHAWASLLAASRALTLRVTEPYIRYRQDFYVHRQASLEATLERLLQIVQLSGLPLSLEATPELLRADLPVLPQLHLGGLGAALADNTLLARAGQLLARGMHADMGLLPPAPRPGLPPRPVKIDLDWFQPFDLNAPPQPEAARRALCLALSQPRETLAFAAAQPAQTPVADFPRLFSWLGDPHRREQEWGALPSARDYTINDWVNSTRTLPARILGLPDKGHLSPGARADVALYELPPRGTSRTWPESFRRCRLLLKAGELVVHHGAVVNAQIPRTVFVRQTRVEPNHLVLEVCRRSSFRLENIRVRKDPEVAWEQVP